MNEMSCWRYGERHRGRERERVGESLAADLQGWEWGGNSVVGCLKTPEGRGGGGGWGGSALFWNERYKQGEKRQGESRGRSREVVAMDVVLDTDLDESVHVRGGGEGRREGGGLDMRCIITWRCWCEQWHIGCCVCVSEYEL